jgi:hypothetical protein
MVSRNGSMRCLYYYWPGFQVQIGSGCALLRKKWHGSKAARRPNGKSVATVLVRNL